MPTCEMACKGTAIEQPASSSNKVRRQVAVATFKKWQSKFEHEHQLLSWLRCDVCEDNRGLVDKLWCELCRKHEHSIQSSKNLSRAWTHSTIAYPLDVFPHVIVLYLNNCVNYSSESMTTMNI